MITNQEVEGDERLLVEDRIQAQIDRIAAQGRAEGLEEGRAEGFAEGFAEGLEEVRAEARAESLERVRSLLRRLVAWRYGTDTAQQVNPLLAATQDPERLTNVGNWIMECATGRDLLERLRNVD